MSKEERVQCAGRNCKSKKDCFYHNNYLKFSIEDADIYKVGNDYNKPKCDHFKKL